MPFKRKAKKPVDNAEACSVQDNIDSKLPTELLVQIFSFLKPKDKTITSRVNKKWNCLASDNSLWKQHLLEEGFAFNDDEKKNNGEYKKVYLKKMSAKLADNKITPNIFYFGSAVRDATTTLGQIILNTNSILFLTRRACNEWLYSASLHKGITFVIYQVRITDQQLFAMQAYERTDERNNRVMQIRNNDFSSVKVEAIYHQKPFKDADYHLTIPGAKDEDEDKEHVNNKGCVIS